MAGIVAKGVGTALDAHKEASDKPLIYRGKDWQLLQKEDSRRLKRAIRG